MKIRILFRGPSINYVTYKNGKPVKLVCLVDAEGIQYDFINNPFKGFSRNYNKTYVP